MVTGAAAGILFATQLRGDPIDRPLQHAYQPLVPGTVWTYEVKQRHDTQGELPESLVTERVSGLLVDHDRVVADVEAHVDATETRPTHTIVLTRDGILPELEVRTEGAYLRAVASRGVYLPAHVLPGQRWHYEVDFEGPGGAAPARVIADLEAVGLQRLAVPAGVFEVLHVRRELRSGELRQWDDLYYAKGVGLVAAVTATTTGYRADRLLKVFSPGAR
jgi:hypothetical protein